MTQPQLEITRRVVRGQLFEGVDFGGKGTISFRRNRLLRSLTVPGLALVPGSDSVELNPDGSFSIQVVTTDDPNWTPGNWEYEVVVRVGGYIKIFPFEVPTGEGDLFLNIPADILPPPPNPAGYVPVDSVGQPGGPAGPLDANGLIPADQIPDTGGGGPGGGPIDWEDIENKPEAFPAEAHTHDWTEIQDKPEAFPPEAHTHDWTEIQDKPEAFPPEAHTHDWSAIEDKPEAFPPEAHTHDWSAIEDKPEAFPPEEHTHNWSAIEDKPEAFPPEEHTHDWSAIEDKPEEFPPEAHTHEVGISDVTGLSTALSGKGDLSGPSSSTNNVIPRFSGTTGKLLKSSPLGVTDNADLTGLRRIERAFSASIGTNTWLDRIDLNYTPATNAMDMLRVYVNGNMTAWFNENYFLRGTPHEGYPDDALVRGVPRSDLASNRNGGWIELENAARNNILYKVDWRTGSVWMGNGSAPAVKMNPVVVLGADEERPDGLPAGTVIMRIVEA